MQTEILPGGIKLYCRLPMWGVFFDIHALCREPVNVTASAYLQSETFDMTGMFYIRYYYQVL